MPSTKQLTSARRHISCNTTAPPGGRLIILGRFCHTGVMKRSKEIIYFRSEYQRHDQNGPNLEFISGSLKALDENQTCYCYF